MSKELEQTKLRFYRLLNGLLAIAYISGFTWVLAKVYQMII